jgi:hypothetical protein
MKKTLAIILLILLAFTATSCRQTKDLTEYGLQLQDDAFYYTYSMDGGYAIYAHNDRNVALSDAEMTTFMQYFEELEDIQPFTYPYLVIIYFSNTELNVSAFLPDQKIFLCYYYSEEDSIEIEFAYSYSKDELLGYKILSDNTDIDAELVLENARNYYEADVEGFKDTYGVDIKDWF